MNLPDIKQLKELLKLLRSQGVLQYQSTDLNLVLSEHLQITNRKSQSIGKGYEEELEQLNDEDPASEIERLIDYSSRPPVEDI